jgi:hypothetical protein
MNESKGLRDQIELWLMLVFLTSLGWSFGLILTSMFVGAIGTSPERSINLTLAGILGGILISLLSMFVLRDAIKSMRIWILAATLGWVLGLLGTIYSIQVISGVLGWIIGGALGGLIYGLVQVFGFKPGFGRGIPWIILNALGWAAAYGLGHAFPSDMGVGSISAMNVTISKGLLGWVMLGTFAVLVLILIFATIKRGDRGGNRVQWWP